MEQLFLVSLKCAKGNLNSVVVHNDFYKFIFFAILFKTQKSKFEYQTKLKFFTSNKHQPGNYTSNNTMPKVG